MKMQLALCAAAGIDVKRMEPMDVYLTSGHIIRDRILTEHALKVRAELDGVKSPSILRIGVGEAALVKMTAADRLALRERVTGVLPFPGVKK